MSKYARIAISLPKPALDAADRLARAQDRSRSWIIAEAIRRFARETQTASPAPAARVAAGLGESRLAQLRRDLALTPEARVRAAEETLRLATRSGTPARQHVTTFERIQDYVDWKRTRDRQD